jgi:hypothetical protein
VNKTADPRSCQRLDKVYRLCDDLVLRERGRLVVGICGSEQLADEAGLYDSEVVALKLELKVNKRPQQGRYDHTVLGG